MPDYRQHKEVNPGVMFCKPIIKGTRITVESIMEELAAGYSSDDVLRTYPHLKKEAVLASLSYAAAVLKNEQTYLAAL